MYGNLGHGKVRLVRVCLTGNTDNEDDQISWVEWIGPMGRNILPGSTKTGWTTSDLLRSAIEELLFIYFFWQSSTTCDESQRSLSVFIAHVQNSYLPLKTAALWSRQNKCLFVSSCPTCRIVGAEKHLEPTSTLSFLSQQFFFISWKLSVFDCFKPSFSLYLMYTVSVCKLYFMSHSSWFVCRNIFLIFLGKKVSVSVFFCKWGDTQCYLSRNKIIANYYHYCLILIAVQALNDCDESNQAVVCTDVMLLKSVF